MLPIKTVKEITIDAVQNGDTLRLLKKTEISAQTVSLPLLFGITSVVRPGFQNHMYVVRDERVIGRIDVAKSLRDVFGYRVADVSAPPPKNTSN